MKSQKKYMPFFQSTTPTAIGQLPSTVVASDRGIHQPEHRPQQSDNYQALSFQATGVYTNWTTVVNTNRDRGIHQSELTW